MPNRTSEMRIAERFAGWLRQTTGQPCTISLGADPPDFLIEPNGWLEITDIYLRNEQARFLNVARERSFGFSGPLDETALRLITRLDEKLGKGSYERIHAQRGKGILLLTCQDCVFDGVNLAHVHQTLEVFQPTNDQGFFQKAYFEYQLPGKDRIYEVVYPRSA